MRRKPCLTSDDVFKMVAACKAKGAQIKREPTIAIVDEAGHLLYLERPDRNGVNTVEMATAKARTAAFRGRSSRAWGERVKERPASADGAELSRRSRRHSDPVRRRMHRRRRRVRYRQG